MARIPPHHRLSSPIADLRESYDVVVVGSGYGGAIAASRLARAGRAVCVLERGRELHAGDFPEDSAAAIKDFQMDAPLGRVGDPTRLFDLRVNQEIGVLVGCGLGGTSLINAGVAVRPDPRIFRSGSWPRALVDDLESLEAGFALAAQMLQPSPYPADWPELPKMRAQERSARAAGVPLRRLPLNIHFGDAVNAAGVPQRACVLCGNCVAGCNHGAKNTLAMNYLPDAKRHGAAIFTEVKVSHLSRSNGAWNVHFRALGAGQERYHAATQFVRAPVVVLAAGVLGSTEILLRSRAAGLPFSSALGTHFTGNGDMLAFSYDCKEPIHGVGFPGATPPEGRGPVGPTITSAIDLRHPDDFRENVMVEEGAVPAALAAFARDAMFAVAEAGVLAEGRVRRLQNGSIEEAAQASQTYLVMAIDDDDGRLVLDDDRVRVVWPGVGRQERLVRAHRHAEAASRALGGRFLPDPIWTDAFGDRLITVHPLGGCPAADDAEHGVVNDRCQVFDAASGTSVHEGLYICDGSVISSPLGVNPLLTISALAERACHYLAEERGWTIDYTPRGGGDTAPLPSGEGEEVPGLRLTERMNGHWMSGVADDFARGAAEGEAAGSSLQFVVTIESADLERMLSDPAHGARLFGTAHAPALSPQALDVTAGVFNLLYEDPSQPGIRRMRYQMRLSTETGRVYWLEGHKRIGGDSPTHALADCTTLYFRVHDGGDAASPILGSGILTIGAEDVVRLVESIEVPRAGGLFGGVKARLRFARFFLGSLGGAYLSALR